MEIVGEELIPNSINVEISLLKIGPGIKVVQKSVHTKLHL